MEVKEFVRVSVLYPNQCTSLHEATTVRKGNFVLKIQQFRVTSRITFIQYFLKKLKSKTG